MTDTTFTVARQKALDAQQAIREAQASLADSIKAALVEGTAPIFEKYPFLGSISWAQYTPYFNDGDPCTFSSCFPDVSLNSVRDIESEEAQEGYEDGPDFDKHADEEVYGDYNSETRTYDRSPNPDYRPEYAECKKEVEEFCKSVIFDDGSSYDEVGVFDGALLSAFGDHVSVSLTRTGEFVVDEYYHD